MGYSIYMTYLFMVVMIAFGMAAYVWQRRNLPGGTSLAFFLVVAGGWTLLDALSAISGTESVARVLDSKARFFCVAFAPPAILLIALDYTHRRAWLRPPRLLALLLIPTVTQLVIWLGPPDAFISESVYVQINGLYLPDSRVFGPWFAIHTGFSYVTICFSVAILLIQAVRSRYPFRQQALLLFGGLSALGVISVFRTYSSGSALRIDWTAVGLIVPIVLWPYALLRYGLLNITPIARDFLIESMDDLVIVLNTHNRIVDYNPAAAAEFNWDEASIMGRPITTVLAGGQWAWLDSLADEDELHTEFVVDEHVFDVRVSPLFQPHLVGRLLVLRDITERKKIESQFASSEAKLASLLTALPDLVFHFDREGRYLNTWGDQHLKKRSTNTPHETIRDKTLFDILPETEAQLLHNCIQRALDTGQLQRVEYRLPTLSGPTDFEAHMVPIGTDQVISVARDITERKQMEQMLRQNEEEVRAFQEKLVRLHTITMELAQIDNLPDLYRRAIEQGREQLGFDRLGLFMLAEDDPSMMVGTFGTDAQGRLRDERGLRYPVVTNDSLREALTDKTRVAYWEDCPLWDGVEVVGRGWNVLAALWNGTEGIGWLAADNLLTQTPLLPYQPELLALYGAALGYLVTKLRHQDALRDSEARFRRLSQAALEGILMHDRGIILDVNPAMATLFGYTTSELIGMHVSEIATQETQSIVLEKIASHNEELYEVAGLRKDGTKFPAEVRARLIPYQGRTVRVAAVRDLTQRKRAEQRTVELAMERERVQILTKFISHATHEFRTPLSVIGTRAYLLQNTENTAKRQEYVADITGQIHSLSRLVDDLVIMTKLDSDLALNKNPLDVNTLLQSLHARFEPTFQDHNLTAVLGLHPELPLIQGDNHQLTRALMKLLENAVRYTEDGGTITLRTEIEAGDLVVTIQDTGIGMTADQQPRIFERFFRADEAHSTPGFGLGLPIAQRIVELHGGHIDMESEPGHGSTFRIRLPLGNPG